MASTNRKGARIDKSNGVSHQAQKLHDEFMEHMKLLSTSSSESTQVQTGDTHGHEQQMTPVFTGNSQLLIEKKSTTGKAAIPQYALLASVLQLVQGARISVPRPTHIWTDKAKMPVIDPRLLINVSAPLSAFICGLQGSGKSHTMSCLLGE